MERTDATAAQRGIVARFFLAAGRGASLFLMIFCSRSKALSFSSRGRFGFLGILSRNIVRFNATVRDYLVNGGSP